VQEIYSPIGLPRQRNPQGSANDAAQTATRDSTVALVASRQQGSPLYLVAVVHRSAAYLHLQLDPRTALPSSMSTPAARNGFSDTSARTLPLRFSTACTNTRTQRTLMFVFQFIRLFNNILCLAYSISSCSTAMKRVGVLHGEPPLAFEELAVPPSQRLTIAQVA
jgi:hypothetical protein